MKSALIIGGGPSGLMAADELSRAGAKVTVLEAKPSIGRKFLMAGKSGLNLTNSEALPDFMVQFTQAQSWLRPMITEFGPEEVMKFVCGLDQDIFTGSSGRVFPVKMKASPMLRAWIERLSQQGVTFQTNSHWIGWKQESLIFETPEGPQEYSADAVVFALGGASWARLGSDGEWSTIFAGSGITLAPFGAANAALRVDWSKHMQPHFGKPLKSIALRSGPYLSRGEAILSSKGIEGGGIYAVSRGIREGHDLKIDLLPDWSLSKVQKALEKPRGKASMSNHLRRALKLEKHEIALLNEWNRASLDTSNVLAMQIKHLKIEDAELAPLDEAISTSGGVTQDAVNENLMLRQKPGMFCTGEMLDWEAPTGGYLLTACFATGRTAGRGAAEYLGLKPVPARA